LVKADLVETNVLYAQYFDRNNRPRPVVVLSKELVTLKRSAGRQWVEPGVPGRRGAPTDAGWLGVTFMPGTEPSAQELRFARRRWRSVARDPFEGELLAETASWRLVALQPRELRPDFPAVLAAWQLADDQLRRKGEAVKAAKAGLESRKVSAVQRLEQVVKENGLLSGDVPDSQVSVSLSQLEALLAVLG